MIKKILLFTLLIISISCATSSKSQVAEISYGEIEIENTGTFTGQKRPDWMSMSKISEIKELYPGKVPFRADMEGANINLLKRRVNTTTLNAQLSSVISSVILEKAKDLMGGNSTLTEAEVDSFGSSITVASRSHISGFIKESEWWIKTKNKESGEEKYKYYVLYLIDQDRFNRMLSGIIDSAAEEAKLDESISKALQNNIEDVTKAYESIGLN